MERLAIKGGKPVSEKMIPITKVIFTPKTIEDVSNVLRSGYIRQGPKTKEFEERFRERVGAEYAYAVNSGTAALHVSYLSILKPGDEIILPAFTFFATASTIIHSNGKLVFADIDNETFLIDPGDVQEKVTERTRAIVPVHLFGNAADMSPLYDLAEDHGLTIVNDSAQAHGTEIDGKDIGSFETMNCYSFYPSKSMTTGEGGMVTTNDEKLYQRGCLFRSHGEDARLHITFGLNYRMTDIAAVIGLNQLKDLDNFLERRRHCGEVLRKGIDKIDGLHPQRIRNGVKHSYSYFTLVMDPGRFSCSREEFIVALKAENIDCSVHYPISLTKQPIITSMMKPEACPISEEISKRIFSLPMHPYLSDEDLEDILKGVEKVATYFHK